LAADPKEASKNSVARDRADLRPDAPLLSRNEMVSLKLTRYAFTPGLLVPTAQTALAFPAALRSDKRARSLSSRLPLLDECQGLRKFKTQKKAKAKPKTAKRTKQSKLLKDDANQVMILCCDDIVYFRVFAMRVGV